MDSKLKKLLLLTLSDNDAEALSALRKAQGTAENWHDLVAKACGGSYEKTDIYANADRYYSGFSWCNPKWQESPEETESRKKAEAKRKEREDLANAFQSRMDKAKAQREMDDLINRFAARTDSNIKREQSQKEKDTQRFTQAGFGDGPLRRYK